MSGLPNFPLPKDPPPNNSWPLNDRLPAGPPQSSNGNHLPSFDELLESLSLRQRQLVTPPVQQQTNTPGRRVETAQNQGPEHQELHALARALQRFNPIAATDATPLYYAAMNRQQRSRYDAIVNRMSPRFQRFIHNRILRRLDRAAAWNVAHRRALAVLASADRTILPVVNPTTTPGNRTMQPTANAAPFPAERFRQLVVNSARARASRARQSAANPAPAPI